MFQTMFGRKPATTLDIKQVRPEEVMNSLQNGAAPLLVDVRTPQEFEWDGHIAGSRLLPLHVLAQRHGELPTDQPIVCVCRSGNRSQVACEQLAALGYTDLSNLSGGMHAWKSRGLPYE